MTEELEREDQEGRPPPPLPRHYRATAEVALTLELAAPVVFRPRPRDPELGELARDERAEEEA